MFPGMTGFNQPVFWLVRVVLRSRQRDLNYVERLRINRTGQAALNEIKCAFVVV